jgi:hypothetical protein
VITDEVAAVDQGSRSGSVTPRFPVTTPVEGSVCSSMSGSVTVGASLTLLTVSVKVRATLSPLVSVAMTVTIVVPTSALAGVPVKVRVAPLKISQPGSPDAV